jgi:hypothetical protein
MTFFAIDTVLNHGTDHSPGIVPSRGVIEPGNDTGICTSATCEASPQREQGSNALPPNTLDEQSGDPKDCEASADAAQSSDQCSARNVECDPDSQETNTSGGDRSFSFEVGVPPKISKAHSPVWSPFPGYKASQSTDTEVAPSLPLSLCVHTRAAYGLLTWFILSTFQIGSENPQPGSPGSSLKITTEIPQPGNALKITTEIPQPGSSLKSKKTSIAKSGKEQLSERKVAESAGGPSENCNIGSSTKNKSSSPAQSHQHPTPECSGMQTSYILTGLTY